MDYKRIEIYVWWTCNQKCTYCIEYPNMEKVWNKKVSKFDILKKLIKYKKLWYNHVTYLWWEPFIQPVFLEALIIAKKLKYTVLVTTNCTTLHIDTQAKKFLPYIDELIISFEAIDKELQQRISRTNVYVHWDWVFNNIEKYWKWHFLKANIVITQDNKNKLYELVEFLNNKGVKNISITYPDLDLLYYWKEHILKNVSPKYEECILEIVRIVEFCSLNKVNLKIVDFPFCIFPIEKIKDYIKITDDYDYQTRIKLTYDNLELDRKNFTDEDKKPRKRKYVSKCNNCLYNKKCWWVSEYYWELYWLEEIKSILI